MGVLSGLLGQHTSTVCTRTHHHTWMDGIVFYCSPNMHASLLYCLNNTEVGERKSCSHNVFASRIQ